MAIGVHILIFAGILVVFAETKIPDNCNVNVDVKPSEACGEVISYGLNDTQIQEILDAHNSNKTGPLKWSNELATQAQAWANQCKSRFDPCVTYLGLNITQSIVDTQVSSGNSSLTEMISFMNTREKFIFNIKDFFLFRRRKRMTGDYTDKVGCGFITYKKCDLPNNHLVCNYGPRGNSNGQAVD